MQVFPTVPSPTTTHLIGRPEDISEMWRNKKYTKKDLLLVRKFFFLQGHINIVIQRKSDSLMMSVNTNTMHLVMQTHSNYPFKLLVETYRLQGPCNYLFIFLQCSTFLSHWLVMYHQIALKYTNKNKITWTLLVFWLRQFS